MSGDIEGVMGAAFDPEEYDTSKTGDFEPLPPAWYPVTIDEAKVEKTSKGTGTLLSLKLTVVGDNFAGRKLWPRLNLKNPNPKAEEIGQRELAAICKAIGLATIADSSDLIDKAIMVRVKVRKEEGRNPDNDVTGYKAIGDDPMAAGVPDEKTDAPAASTKPKKAATTPSAPKKRPWEK